MRKKTYKQHFVPKSYLKQWGEKDKVYITDIHNGKTYYRNISKLFLIEHIYSITLNEWSLVEDYIKFDFFDVLSEYNVYYNGNLLDNFGILNNLMNYDKFEITRGEKNISEKERKDVWDKIFNNYSDELEEKYAKCESEFAKTIFSNDQNIFNALLNNTKNKENIIKNIYLFAQQLYIRNPYIIMFHSNRINEIIENNKFRRLFKSFQIEGFNQRNLFPQGLNLRFLYNQTSESFVTSDIPVILDLCEYDDYKNNKIHGKFLLILSPKIAVIFFSNNNNQQKYELLSVDNDGVKVINKKIKDSCSNYYISSNLANDVIISDENDELNFYNYNCRGIFKLINEKIKRE